MIPMEYFNLDKGKFHELVIHSANLMADDRTASIIRINKILYYADFASYRETTRPITGACYRKYNEGPRARLHVLLRPAPECHRQSDHPNKETHPW